MRLVCRLLALGLVVALVATGPLAAYAQALGTSAAEQPQASPEFQEKPHQGAYDAGAAAASVFLVPGRFVLCTLGTAGALVVMGLTFGTQYGTAKRVFEEGCVGKWVVSGDDLRRENERRGIPTDAYLR